MNIIEIDRDKCVKCGQCIKDCIAKCIESGDDNYPVMVNEERCLKCQHCFMICPTGALSFNGLNPDKSEKPSSKTILSLIKSRRSIRQFKDEEISEQDMKRIQNMLPYIPTGCNSHSLHFSIVTNKSVMQELKEMVNKNLLKAFNNPLLKSALKKYEYVYNGIEQGEDIVFRNAPNMIVVSSPITAPCASTDPIIALSYIELYANSLGLGTCWGGYPEICIKLFPEISEILNIPKGYIPVYAMLLGLPAVNYARTPQPEEYKISEIKDIIPKDSCLFCKIKRFVTNLLR